MPNQPDLGPKFKSEVMAIVGPYLPQLERVEAEARAKMTDPADHVVLKANIDATTKAVTWSWQFASKLVTRPPTMTPSAWKEMKTAPFPGFIVVHAELSDTRCAVLFMRRSPPKESLA